MITKKTAVPKNGTSLVLYTPSGSSNQRKTLFIGFFY
jgi:hypothetical protein